MASNPYVNKVIYGDQTVMDISDSTASESDVAEGAVFYKANGARSVGTASSNYYSPTDATSTDIDDADYIPFYDNSASAKKNSLWSNIVAKMKTAFGISSGNTYLKKDGTWGTPTNTKNTAGSTDTSDKIYLVGAKSQAANPQTYSDNEVFAQDGVLSSKKLSPKCITALTGTGTAGQDKGSGATNRYVPALWTFNSGITVADGEVYFIKIPVAGGTYGVYLSLNNGTNYYPVAISNAKARFQTQSPINSVIAVSYESTGVCNCYAQGGADALADVTGCFRMVDSYDSNTTYSAMSASELTTGTVTTSRVVRSDYLKSGINSLIDTKINALDVTGASNIAASKTIKAWSETDGKVSVTTQDIAIASSQVSGLATVATSGSYNDLLDKPDEFMTYANNGVLGAKNLLPNNAVSTEYNGITYTVNADGTVTANGSTSSLSSNLKLCELSLTAGDKYIVSGGYNNKVRINIYLKSNPSTEILVADTDYLWTVPATGTYVVQIYVNTNTSVTNALLKPMIRLGTDADSTYQPFAMTNKELTDNFGTLGSAATKDVPASGDAGQTEVVLGSDTRLTDARTPTSHTHSTSEITDFPTLATVATSGSYGDLIDEPTNQSAQQFSSTVSLCTRNEKYLWNYAYNSALKWFSASALTGATSVIISVGSFSDYGLNGDIVAILADDGTTKPVKCKTATAEEGGGGVPDYVEITFSALAHDTTFKVGII